eukprot:COSAG02_NODE_1008_length_15238_cov_24.345928_1_plen_506_part_00
MGPTPGSAGPGRLLIVGDELRVELTARLAGARRRPGLRRGLERSGEMKRGTQESSPYSALRGKVCVVTGSQGMFGLSLCKALLTASAAEVRGFDRVAPRETSGARSAATRGRSRSPSHSPAKLGDRHPRVVDTANESRSLALPVEYRSCVRHFCGDITSSRQLRAACRGADVVFHAASYGMSGEEMLDRTQTRAVNISGTKHVLDCARSENVGCLVYTSTYNTVFGGQRVDRGNEAMGYYPVEDHADEYSRTKALAEQLVLAADGSARSDAQEALRTVALRSAAIYGEGERRHFPRIIQVTQLAPQHHCICRIFSSTVLPSCVIRRCAAECTCSPSAMHPTFAIGFMWTTSCMLICWLRLQFCKPRPTIIERGPVASTCPHVVAHISSAMGPRSIISSSSPRSASLWEYRRPLLDCRRRSLITWLTCGYLTGVWVSDKRLFARLTHVVLQPLQARGRVLVDEGCDFRCDTCATTYALARRGVEGGRTPHVLNRRSHGRPRVSSSG